jgi:hypothetical protein
LETARRLNLLSNDKLVQPLFYFSIAVFSFDDWIKDENIWREKLYTRKPVGSSSSFLL